MLKVSKKGRTLIWRMVSIGLFGIAGLLLVSIVRGIEKIAAHYPKAFFL